MKWILWVTMLAGIVAIIVGGGKSAWKWNLSRHEERVIFTLLVSGVLIGAISGLGGISSSLYVQITAFALAIVIAGIAVRDVRQSRARELKE